MDERGLTCYITPGRTSLFEARDFLRRAAVALDLHGSDREALLVVANELVVSAIIQETTEFRVGLVPRTDALRIEVWRPDLLCEDGASDSTCRSTGLLRRGIPVVDDLTRDWGLSPVDEGGSIVWAEISVLGPGPSLPSAAA